jgi:hypothetical protein
MSLFHIYNINGVWEEREKNKIKIFYNLFVFFYCFQLNQLKTHFKSFNLIFILYILFIKN